MKLELKQLYLYLKILLNKLYIKMILNLLIPEEIFFAAINYNTGKKENFSNPIYSEALN